MISDIDRQQESTLAASFDWDPPLQNTRGDFLEPLPFHESFLKDVDIFGNDTDNKRSLADRFIDLACPQNPKKRKERDDNVGGGRPFFVGSPRRRKKPDGTPKRPLSAYNCFFQEERVRLMQKGQEENGPNILPSGKIGFEELGKRIGKKWKSLTEAEKQRYHRLASEDSDRYNRQMEAWMEKTEVGMQKKAKSHDEGRDLPEAVSKTSMLRDTETQFQEDFAHRPYSPLLLPPSYQRDSNLNIISPSFSASESHCHTTTRNRVFAAFPFESLCVASGRVSTEPFRQFQDPPSDAVPVSPGMEVSMTDQHDIQQKYKIKYGCYLVTLDEAKEYLEQFGDCPLHVGPPPPFRYGHSTIEVC